MTSIFEYLNTLQVLSLSKDVQRLTTELQHLRTNQERIIEKRCLEQRWKVRGAKGFGL